MKRKWINPSTENGQNTRLYNMWLHARNRCTKGSRNQLTNPTYIGCEMFSDWYDYDKFHNWVVSDNFHSSICRNGFYYQLDKDLLFKHNKVYSPDTCVFIPKEVNSFLTKREKCRGNTPLGVYLYDVGVFRAMISNPFSKKSEHLGLFSNPLDAFSHYKKRKEELAKLFCEVYRGKIASNVTEALMSYNVDITD